ncbi:MAG: cation:proton antiporter [Cyanobacteriota bacterium]|jgi:cell volume regulation protein A|nr:cation:proton antiporter [Cyanobacteriota bacterium]
MTAVIATLLASVGAKAGEELGETLLVRGQPLPVVLAVLGVLLLATLAIRRFSLQLGAPAILGVLLFGLLIPNQYELFQDTTISNLHTVGLSMLLFFAGLQTELRSIRGFLEYGVVLAIGGVIVSSTLLGLLIWASLSSTGSGIALGLHQLPLGLAMLIAACLGSTDAGATLSVLHQVRDRVPERLRNLLEFESSLNDPAAILFLGLVLGLIGQTGAASERVLISEVRLFIQNIASGVLIGVILGYVCRFCLNRLAEQREQLLIFAIAFAAISYGGSTLLGGSGFISAYVTGLFLANYTYANPQISASALQEVLAPFNTMMEVVIFLVFGLTTEPERVLPLVPAGLLVALAMMLVARPVSVLIFQPLSPFRLNETLLVAWCGLRGAVPLALALELVAVIPSLGGLAPAQAELLARNVEGIVFTVVVVNLLVQGLSLPWVCRRLGLSPAD